MEQRRLRLAAVLAAALLRFDRDGKEVGGKMPTPPSVVGAGGAEPTPEIQATTLADDRKTPWEGG